MKIPGDEKKLVVTNGKDAYNGAIAYTKNIDLREDGYIRLAAPMCRIVSEAEEANLGLAIDIFSYSDGSFKLTTDNSMYNLVLSSLNFSEDTQGSPSDQSRVVQWVDNDWFLGLEDVYEFTAATPTTVYTSRISDQLGYIEVFVSRNTLVGAFGNSILRQYNEDYTANTHLVLPDNFTITGAAFSNLLMGVATRQGKNRGNAFFFTWDGSTAEANNGYPVNDPFILDVAAYNSSWVLFTSSGELLYFNGGGFEQLGTLPVFDLDIQLIALGPNNSIGFGKILDVNGDIVFVNCASLPEIAESMKPYLPHFSAGVYCYDPKHGFYHMYAPSYSEYQERTWTATSSVLDLGAAHYLETGDEVWCKTGSHGLEDETLYYAIKQDDNKIKLAESYDDAQSNTAITLTNGSVDLFSVKRFDFGIEALRLQDMGLVRSERAFSGYYQSGALSFFVGANVRPNDVAQTRVNIFCAKVPIMSNRGYVLYSKFQAGAGANDAQSDMWQAVVVKYRKLKPGSSIIVKAKVKDQEAVIVGDGSLYDESYIGESVTWDSSGNYFETTADLSEVEVDDEIHIFDGAGAGQTAHITNIEQDDVSGVWQVTLDEVLRGITAGAKSCVSIEAFRKLGTIDSNDDEGSKRVPLGSPRESVDIKLELRGKNVLVKECYPVSTPQQND